MAPQSHFLPERAVVGYASPALGIRSPRAEPFPQSGREPFKGGRTGKPRVCSPAGGACPRGLVAVGGVDPPIAKSDEKLSRILICGFLGARRAFLRFLPAVSNLFSHRCLHPLQQMFLDNPEDA
jgi:hypothetical protein